MRFPSRRFWAAWMVTVARSIIAAFVRISDEKNVP